MIDIKKELDELKERLAELEAKVKENAEPKPKITRLEKLRENVAARISSFDFETIWTSGVNSGLSVALSIIDAAIAEERAPKGKAPGRDCDSCNFNDFSLACKSCDVNGSMWMPRKPEPEKPEPGDVVEIADYFELVSFDSAPPDCVYVTLKGSRPLKNRIAIGAICNLRTADVRRKIEEAK